MDNIYEKHRVTSHFRRFTVQNGDEVKSDTEPEPAPQSDLHKVSNSSHYTMCV